MRWLCKFGCLGLLLSIAGAGYADPPVTTSAPVLQGQVTDPLTPSQTGAAGVRLGRGWLWNIETPNAYTLYDVWPLDAAGNFRVTADGVNNWPLFYPLSLFALSADGKRGGAVVVPRAGTPVKLRLSPLTPVRYRFRVDGVTPPPTVFITFGPQGGGKVITVPSGMSGTVPLPPGNWSMHIASADTLDKTVQFTVKPGAADVDLGPTTLALGRLARRYGKPAPQLHVSETVDGSGTSLKPFDLAAQRGKWVLIDFWGWWCPPCVTKSLPDAVDFYDKHPEWRDRFQIVAFHCLNAKTAADLKPHLQSLTQNNWKGRPLPFPIVLDASEKTIAEWGVTLYPSSVLIDPRGNVVRGGSLQRLEQALRAAPDQNTPPK